MPIVNSEVRFSVGTQQHYDSLIPDTNTVYFCQDSGRLFVGQYEYCKQDSSAGTPITGITVNDIYPIGIIITFYDNEDHSNFLGLTWQRCLQGRSPIGVDSNDTDFRTVGSTLGEKSHVLTPEEVPQLTSTTVVGNGNQQHQIVGPYGNNGSAHNNIQPSEVVAFWRRIS